MSAHHKAIGRIGANIRWAHEPDRKAATQAARDGLMQRFRREVDPENVLEPDEQQRRADSAMRAYYQRMALARVKKGRLSTGSARPDAAA